jgi:capsular exopolysaccharide synthesis family protein
MEEAMAKAEIEGLRIITSGPLPPDATHVLRAGRMREIIGELKSNADLVIFDSPPLLTVSDALILAPMVDGVLLVVDARSTSREVVRRGMEVLGRINPPIVGAVLNKYSSKDGGYYYYYQQGGDRDEPPRRWGLGVMSTLFGNVARGFGPLSRGSLKRKGTKKKR